MHAFAPGGGLVYNHDDNWQWFAGVYKGFIIPGYQQPEMMEVLLNKKQVLLRKLV